MPELRVLSLGWGVQSFTLAAMSALGELPKLDMAIHADTTWEREATYKFVGKWMPWLESHGLKVVETGDPVAAKQPIKSVHNLFIPAFVKKIDGEGGMLRRQCTERWKIAPMRRVLRAELETRGLSKRTPGVIEQWLGISKDEWSRARSSDVSYIKHRFPLLERKMTRGDCINWLQSNGLEVPGKSSCTHCVYHGPKVWQEMKKENGPDWKQALDFDATIRNKSSKPGRTMYIHSSLKPLNEAVKIPEDAGYSQQEMFIEELGGCTSAGHCWV